MNLLKEAKRIAMAEFARPMVKKEPEPRTILCRNFKKINPRKYKLAKPGFVGAV
jgi:hypothetical protein